MGDVIMTHSDPHHLVLLIAAVNSLDGDDLVLSQKHIDEAEHLALTTWRDDAGDLNLRVTERPGGGA